MKSLNNLKTWIQETINTYNFKSLTDIQEKTIHLLLKNENIVGISSTGSGKTLAFLIPLLNKIELNDQIQAVIISPTRELATQIYKKINEFSKFEPQLKSQFISGGEKTENIIKKIINKKPQIIVSTPIKLLDVLKDRNISLSNLSTLVIDEADMLMDLDFWPCIDKFLESFNNDNLQKSAWSATLHEQLAIKLKKSFKNTKIIQIGESIYKNNKIKHHIVQTNDNFKTLDTLIRENNFYLCIIFANTKKQVDEIYNHLLKNKINAVKIHGDLSKRERAKNFNDIKKLKYQFIVASDLASRGMDIDGVSHVISWNIPNTLEWYIHRSGRCGRGKYTGDSYIIHNGSNFKEIDKLKEKNIEFNYYVQKNNKIILINEKKINLNNKNVTIEKINIEIKKLDNKSNKKIKPNYRKKMKKRIDDIYKKNTKNKRK